MLRVYCLLVYCLPWYCLLVQQINLLEAIEFCSILSCQLLNSTSVYLKGCGSINRSTRIYFGPSSIFNFHKWYHKMYESIIMYEFLR